MRFGRQRRRPFSERPSAAAASAASREASAVSASASSEAAFSASVVSAAAASAASRAASAASAWATSEAALSASAASAFAASAASRASIEACASAASAAALSASIRLGPRRQFRFARRKRRVRFGCERGRPFGQRNFRRRGERGLFCRELASVSAATAASFSAMAACEAASSAADFCEVQRPLPPREQPRESGRLLPRRPQLRVARARPRPRWRNRHDDTCRRCRRRVGWGLFLDTRRDWLGCGDRLGQCRPLDRPRTPAHFHPQVVATACGGDDKSFVEAARRGDFVFDGTDLVEKAPVLG